MTETVTHMDEFENLKLNSLIGAPPEMKSSSLTISGKNNILYCEDGVVIENSIIRFSGDNSIIVLGSSKHPYKLNATIYNNCSLLIGRNCYFNGPLNVIVSEEQDVVIGNDCLISFGIWVRTADPHLIYDCATCTRINPSRNIVVGDHVWIGQAATILKNTIIGSGSIIGATSLVSGKRIPSNTSWGGIPLSKSEAGFSGMRPACINTHRPILSRTRGKTATSAFSRAGTQSTTSNRFSRTPTQERKAT